MPNPLRFQEMLHRAVKAVTEDFPTKATITAVDGPKVDIRLGQSSTVVRNIAVVGDIRTLQVSQEVKIDWIDREGTAGKVPVVMANTVGPTSGSTNPNPPPDDITVYVSDLGLSVKPGGIGRQHLNFNPSEAGHTHRDSLQQGGWQVTPDGIVYNGTTYIHPTGQITLGLDPDLIKLDSEHATYRLWAGANDPATAPFSISKAGAIKSSSGAIGGWNVTANTISDVAGLVGLSSVVTAGSDIRFWAGNATPANAPFRVDETGSIWALNATIQGTLRTSVFEKNSVSATAGTLGVFKSAGKLLANVTTVTSPTTFNVDIEDPASGHAALFAANDILRIKDASNDNWVTVSSVSDQTTFYRYVCTKSSGTNATFLAGLAVIDYGPSGQGFIMQTADAANAPHFSIKTHAGSPWSTTTELVRLGNMNGAYGVTSDYYGVGIGDYTGGNYLKYDTNGGFVLKAGAGNVLIDADGITLPVTTAKFGARGSAYTIYDAADAASTGFMWGTKSNTYFDSYQYATGQANGVQLRSIRGAGQTSAVDVYIAAGYQATGNFNALASIELAGSGSDGAPTSLITHTADGHLFYGDVYTDVFTDYSTTSTITGFSSTTVKKIWYKKVGKLVHVWWALVGTSNSVAFTFTLPYAVSNLTNALSPQAIVRVKDNGGSLVTGVASAGAGTSVLTLYSSLALGAWTATNGKEAYGELFYETA